VIKWISDKNVKKKINYWQFVLWSYMQVAEEETDCKRVKSFRM
jgi:hypothetical protein